MNPFPARVESIFKEIAVSYADGGFFLPRTMLDKFGVTKDGVVVYPLKDALLNPANDGSKSVLYLMASDSADDFRWKDKNVSEVYVFNPSDVFFWANMNREYNVSDESRTLSRSDFDLTWKFTRFKLRNFSGFGLIKDMLEKAGMGDALQDGQASFTSNMTRASGKDGVSFSRFSETFGPALTTRSYRMSCDDF
jgi:hypothetical protein